MRRKHGAISTILLLILCLRLVACAGETPLQPATAAPAPDGQAGGVVLDDISQRFRFTLFPARVTRDAEGEYIAYRLVIENKTEELYRKLRVKVLLNPGLDPYLAAGAVPIEFRAVDFLPKSQSPSDHLPDGARGLDLAMRQALAGEDRMRGAQLDRKAVPGLAGSLTLELRWQKWLWWDNLETHQLRTGVLDETEAGPPRDGD